MILLTGVRVVVLNLAGTAGVSVFKINVFSTLVDILGELRIFFLFEALKFSGEKSMNLYFLWFAMCR